MARRTLEERLEYEEQKAREQERKIRRLKAQVREQKRKEATRRKILLGAVVMARMEENARLKEAVQQWLDEDLTRPIDRALFGLDLIGSGDTESHS